MQSCLICDDHAMMREAMAGTVAMAWPDATVTLASDFPGAWEAMESAPDLCICDLVMPGASPLEGISTLGARAASPILVVTGSEDDNLLLALFRLGIAGFVPKTARSAVIEAAIRVVLAGERYLPARFLQLIDSNGGPIIGTAGTRILSSRQVEVLRLVAAGQSNKEIARSLLLSPSTVKVHLAAAMTALGATNRTEAVSLAQRTQLI